jgi:4-amino-4-deoxy-L-arabinose transferase-like glycosyltransferase
MDENTWCIAYHRSPPKPQGKISQLQSANLTPLRHRDALFFPVGRTYTTPRYALVLLGLWLLLYASFALFLPPLLDDADSVHAEAAREMLVRHDHVTLTVNGIRYLEKAPLLYWLMAGFLKLFGGPAHVHVWAARLPLALAVLVLMYLARRMGRELFQSDRAGFYAAIVLLTSFGIFIFTRILIPDILLTLFLALTLRFFWRTLSQDDPSLADCAGMAACCALAVLTKGLIGLIFPAAIIFLYLVCTRDLLHLLRIRPASQFVIFMIIAAPWHWLASIANPAHGHPVGFAPTPGNVRGFAWFYFVDDQFARYVGRRLPHDYDTVPLLLFWSLILIWMLPWSAFLFKALRRVPLWTGIKRAEISPALRPWLFCGLWALAILLFFSFSTRQEYYVLPALPALALLIGAWLAAEHHASFSPPEGELTEWAQPPLHAAVPETAARLLLSGRRIATVLLVLGWLSAIAALFLVIKYPPPPNTTDVSALLHPATADYALSFGHFLDLRLRMMGVFRWPLIICALAFAVGTTGNYFFRQRRRPGTGNMFLAGMAVAFLIASWVALVTFSPVLSSSTLASAIAPELDENSLIVVNGEYEEASSLNWYLQQPLHIMHEPTSDLWYGSFFPDAPEIWETPASLAAQWPEHRRIFVWTHPGALPPLPGPVYVIAENGGKQIVSNQPNQGGASF